MEGNIQIFMPQAYAPIDKKWEVLLYIIKMWKKF